MPGQHQRYGELKGFNSHSKPVWGLAQWNSKFPLFAASPVKTTDGGLVFSNAPSRCNSVWSQRQQRTFHCRQTPAWNTALKPASLANRGRICWLSRSSIRQRHWQNSMPRNCMSRRSSNRQTIFTRTITGRRSMRPQFQIFFIVQNRDQQSPGYGDLLWFGVPIYDNRNRFPEASMAQDFGGTAKFIFTPGAKNIHI